MAVIAPFQTHTILSIIKYMQRIKRYYRNMCDSYTFFQRSEDKCLLAGVVSFWILKRLEATPAFSLNMHTFLQLVSIQDSNCVLDYYCPKVGFFLNLWQRFSSINIHRVPFASYSLTMSFMYPFWIIHVLKSLQDFFPFSI